MAKEAVLKVFREKGQLVQISGNSLLPLYQEEAVFLLESGSVNLFAIEMRKEGPNGPRRLITHFEAPSLLFAIPSDPNAARQIFAAAEEPCHLRKLSSQQMREELQEALIREGFEALLSHWIYCLSDLFEKDLQRQEEITLSAGEEKSLAIGESLAPKQTHSPGDEEKIIWLEIVQGKCALGSQEKVFLTAESKLFPLRQHLWIHAVEQSQVRGISSEKLVADGRWIEGLRSFRYTTLEMLVEQKEQQEAGERARFTLRGKREEKLLDEALKSMTAILNPLPSFALASKGSTLFSACQIIGKAMGITFIQREETDSIQDLPSALEELCEGAGVRNRIVSLRRKWWKEDSGHLLAFYGESNQPVALIRKGQNYELVDPEKMQSTRVTKSVALRLHLKAYRFYIPFPDDLKSGGAILRFFFKHTSKEYLPLLLFSTIGALIALFPPFATRILFSTVIPDLNLSLLVQVSIGLLIAAISASLFVFFRALSILRLEGLADNLVQSGMWDRLLKLPVHFFRRYSTGNLIRRVMAMTEIRQLISGNVSRVMISGIFSLFYIIAMAIYAPRLILISIAPIFLGLLITALCSLRKTHLEREILEIEGTLNGTLIQIIGGVAKLRVSGAENPAFTHWADSFQKDTQLRMRAQQVQNIATVTNAVLPIVSLMAIFFLAMEFMKTGTGLSLGNFLAFNVAFISFSTAIFDLGNTFIQAAPIIPMWQRSRVITEEPLEIVLKKEKSGRLQGDVHIDGISFRYDPTTPLVLDDVSISATPGEFVGIIGPSGCGKSTLVRLLLGFEKPEKGAIYYDGKDLAGLDIRSVRRQIGAVLQGEGIIAGSLYDNIVCGVLYKGEEIQRALELSEFSKDLEEFPMGLHTYIAAGGEILSGGQKQRLMIARALISNPKILLMDEATSALDNETQKKISANLSSLNVTRIIIAHRLSTIREAHRIYVIDQGRIQDVGSFNELAGRCKIFQEMLKRQML